MNFQESYLLFFYFSPWPLANLSNYSIKSNWTESIQYMPQSTGSCFAVNQTGQCERRLWQTPQVWSESCYSSCSCWEKKSRYFIKPIIGTKSLSYWKWRFSMEQGGHAHTSDRRSDGVVAGMCTRTFCVVPSGSQRMCPNTARWSLDPGGEKLMYSLQGQKLDQLLIQHIYLDFYQPKRKTKKAEKWNM